MMLDVLLKKVISEKDSCVFSHSRFKQFFVASGAYQEVDVAPGYTFCAVAAVCTCIPTCRGICVVREQRLAWNTRWLLTQLTGH